MAQHGAAWRSMAQHGAAWRSMAQHGAAWRSTAQHGAARLGSSSPSLLGAMSISLSEINPGDVSAQRGRDTASNRPESVELHDVWSSRGAELPKGCCYSCVLR